MEITIEQLEEIKLIERKLIYKELLKFMEDNSVDIIEKYELKTLLNELK